VQAGPGGIARGEVPASGIEEPQTEITTMATANELHAIWTNGDVMEAMHGMRRVLGEWERVGAAEEVDLDEMAEVESQFNVALAEFQVAMQAFGRSRRNNG